MSGSGSDGQGKSIFGQYAVRQQTPFDTEKLANRHRHQDTGWTIPEAYIGLMLAAASADGRIDNEELREISAVARRSRALRSLTPEQVLAAAEGARQRFEQKPDSAVGDACKTLPAELCLPAFTHCVDIVVSDGELLDSEARWLEGIMPQLDIDEDHGRRILEVMMLKANY
jgi:tellurite resistance protein